MISEDLTLHSALHLAMKNELFMYLYVFKVWPPPVTDCVFYNPVDRRMVFSTQHLQHRQEPMTDPKSNLVNKFYL